MSPLIALLVYLRIIMKTSFKTLVLFWQENMRHKKYFLTTTFSWLGGMSLQKLILPVIIAQTLDELLKATANPPANYWSLFLPHLLAFLVVAAIAQVFVFLGLFTLSRLETLGRPALQNRIFQFLIDKSMQFHANTFGGSLVAQVNRFTSAYISLTDQLILNIIRMVTNVVMAIIIIAFISWPIALAMAVWTAFFTWFNIILTRRRLYLSRAAAAADSVLTGHLADTVGNIGAVKAFAREKDEAKEHNIKNLDRAQKKYASWIKATKNDALYGSMMIILQFGVLLLSIISVMNGSITIGTVLLVQIYVTQIIGELWSLSGISRHIEQAISDSSEMTEILHSDLEVKDPEKPETSRIQTGAITFDAIDFRHADADETLFKNFTLNIKPGEKIGLVGHSGSGKTTLTRLLLRFTDVEGGAIRIDQQDIRAITQADLRRAIAYVPQEPLLFHRSLRENIAYGKPNATIEQIMQAAKQAYATEFIEKLPNGYETTVGERGIKLSGGQRQRIAIARAILKDAPILVLDEATSALDSESERLIQKALSQLMQHRTAIVIAHRLSTVQRMDKIIVLDNGKIIEQGSHAELLVKQGAYATLWAHQSGGFIEE
jgi:ATP-binding cassette subfamily B protein